MPNVQFIFCVFLLCCMFLFLYVSCCHGALNITTVCFVCNFISLNIYIKLFCFCSKLVRYQEMSLWCLVCFISSYIYSLISVYYCWRTLALYNTHYVISRQPTRHQYPMHISLQVGTRMKHTTILSFQAIHIFLSHHARPQRNPFRNVNIILQPVCAVTLKFV